MSDPLFEEDDRNAILPIKYPTVWEIVKNQRGCFWQAHEVSLNEDEADWAKLNEDEQFFIKMVLAFFATSDLIVNKNIADRFINDVKALEVIMMYNIQSAIEDIHSEMYALLIDRYIKDPKEKDYLFNAVKNIPIISKKAAWANNWIHSDKPYSNRLVAFACVEGIFFSGSFCAIFWLRERGLMPGLCLSNEYISRDEGLHCAGAIEIYNLLQEKESESVIFEIVKSAVELETEFIIEALPCKLIGMNSQLMTEYIKYVANRLLKQFGYNPLYPVKQNPFPFMARIELQGKSNFFEKRPSDYSKLQAEDAEDAYAVLE